jgi:hypothetical protein
MSELLERLEAWKRRFDPLGAVELESLLTAIAAEPVTGAPELIRLHEALLFLRAYPLSQRVARLADRILFSFADRFPPGADLDPYEAPEVSGIAGTSLTAIFSYEVARHLGKLDPRHLEIAWDRHDEQDRMGPVVRKLLPMFQEDWPVEAHVPFAEWIAAAHPRRESDLQWLLARVADPDVFDSMRLPLTWRMARHSRSHDRLPTRKLYLHREPLLRRADVSLELELQREPLPVKKLAPPQARRILDAIMATSAMRYRELYGFSHPDEANVFHADSGRGVDIYFFGVPPKWRLPLRAYHAAMFFKNGVPAGYVELLSFFERAEVGFNLYYTFREGESAWIYAQLLRLFHQELGVTCFSVDAYQIGQENAEAVDSGAFWFYRKLGFRPTSPKIAHLVAREERRMSQTPGYRSPRRTLEKLAEGPLLYELPGTATGDWDRFRIRTLAQRLQKGGAAERQVIEQIARAKRRGPETLYLRWMQGQTELRKKLAKWGTA